MYLFKAFLCHLSTQFRVSKQWTIKIIKTSSYMHIIQLKIVCTKPVNMQSRGQWANLPPSLIHILRIHKLSWITKSLCLLGWGLCQDFFGRIVWTVFESSERPAELTKLTFSATEVHLSQCLQGGKNKPTPPFNSSRLFSLYDSHWLLKADLPIWQLILKTRLGCLILKFNCQKSNCMSKCTKGQVSCVLKRKGTLFSFIGFRVQIVHLK